MLSHTDQVHTSRGDVLVLEWKVCGLSHSLSLLLLTGLLIIRKFCLAVLHMMVPQRIKQLFTDEDI